MGSGMAMAVIALLIYVLGGVGTLAGLGLLVFVGEGDLWGWGDGHSLGYLLICVGLVLSIAGVMVMRLIRNRSPD